MDYERVYTDERFEGLQIRNSGGPTFNIWAQGEISNYYHENGWSNIDCFTHYARDGEDRVCEHEAEEVAQEHFDEMYYMQEHENGEHDDEAAEECPLCEV